MIRLVQVMYLGVFIHCILLCHRSSQRPQPVQRKLIRVLHLRPVQLQLPHLLHHLLDHQLLLHHLNLQLFTSKLSSVDLPLVHLCCHL